MIWRDFVKRNAQSLQSDRMFKKKKTQCCFIGQGILGKVLNAGVPKCFFFMLDYFSLNSFISYFCTGVPIIVKGAVSVMSC